MRTQSLRLSSGSINAGHFPGVPAASAPKDAPEFHLTPIRGTDLSSTEQRAELLAARIIRTWERQGHKVDAWVVKETSTMYGPFSEKVVPTWSVRTDLIGGMPSGLGRKKFEQRFGSEG